MAAPAHSSQTKIPQTLTMMEACFTLAPGVDDEFWAAQEKFGPIAASAPGFQAVLGGPIANSSWLYFGGVFESPQHMDDWHYSRQHGAVQRKAHETWFNSFYIRKWRLPAEGEQLSGRVLADVTVGRETPLSDAEMSGLVQRLNSELPEYQPRPFETAIGQYEPHPYQLVGPLEEAPQPAPVRYLLLTHWDSADLARRWLDSPVVQELKELGDMQSRLFTPIYHRTDERENLTGDGMHREWFRS